MSSVKEEALTSISYLKYEAQKLQDEINEHEEYLKYINMLPYDRRKKHVVNVSKIQEQLNTWRRELSHLNMQINNIKNYYELSKSDIQAVEIPTEEQLNKQWRAIEREASAGYTKDYTEEEHKRIFETVALRNHLADMEEYMEA